MKVGANYTQNILNVAKSQVKKPVKNIAQKVSMPVAGLSAAALTGMCMVNKARSPENDVKISAICSDNENHVSEMTRTYTNPQTGRKETLNMKISDISGVYNSTITDDMGNTRVESQGYKTPDGTVVVEKNFEGLDGTKTHYTYSSKDKNDIKMHYQVTSPDGEVLSTIDRTFNRVSPNLAYSSLNGKEYKIEKTEDSINITTSGETTKIGFDEIFYDEEAQKHSELIDNMSGDMLLDMHKRGFRYNYIDNADITEMEPCEKIVSIKNDLFDFSHELGHTKDLEYSYDDDYNLNIVYNIAQNPEFRSVFEEERANFIKNCPKQEQKYIDYFIEKEGHYNEENGGAAEVVAEANALLSTATGSECNDHLNTRDYYLQKYFPRSIAAASKLLFE